MNMLLIFTGEENFKISNLLVEHVGAVIKVDTNFFADNLWDYGYSWLTIFFVVGCILQT